MTSFLVGPGVSQAMADHGDEPRSDEQYIITDERSQISRTYGRDGVYYYLAADNAVRRIAFVDELSPDPPSTWPDYFNEHRDLVMQPQALAWTCSICAACHTLQMTGLDPYAAREKVAVQLGYPSCVDEWSGLKDTQCLVNLFSDYGVEARQEWVDWDRAYQLCSETAGVLNGLGYYHFVSIRNVTSDGQLAVGNSAKGYRGIDETISRDQFNNWGLGPWQIVYLVH